MSSLQHLAPYGVLAVCGVAYVHEADTEPNPSALLQVLVYVPRDRSRAEERPPNGEQADVTGFHKTESPTCPPPRQPSRESGVGMETEILGDVSPA